MVWITTHKMDTHHRLRYILQRKQDMLHGYCIHDASYPALGLQCWGGKIILGMQLDLVRMLIICRSYVTVDTVKTHRVCKADVPEGYCSNKGLDELGQHSYSNAIIVSLCKHATQVDTERLANSLHPLLVALLSDQMKPTQLQNFQCSVICLLPEAQAHTS